MACRTGQRRRIEIGFGPSGNGGADWRDVKEKREEVRVARRRSGITRPEIWKRALCAACFTVDTLPLYIYIYRERERESQRFPEEGPLQLE